MVELQKRIDKMFEKCLKVRPLQKIVDRPLVLHKKDLWARASPRILCILALKEHNKQRKGWSADNECNKIGQNDTFRKVLQPD